MQADGRGWRRGPRFHAAAAAVVTGGVLASVGVAGAAQDQSTIAEGTGTSSKWSVSAIAVETGDTVTWDFAAPTHNVTSTNASATDASWEGFAYPAEPFGVAPVGSKATYTFYKSGTFAFVCDFHPNSMSGTVTVSGEDQEPPVGSPPPTPSPSPSPSPPPPPPPGPAPGPVPAPAPGDPVTPPPSGSGRADAEAPAVSSVRARAVRRGAKLSFELSEAATVTLRFTKRGSRKVVRTVRRSMRAGSRTVEVRGGGLGRGRYQVAVSVRDAGGNVADSQTIAVRVKRR